jgi:hypothetical protein
MEARPGVHHCKSDCNSFYRGPWASFLINLYSFVTDEEAASVGILRRAEVLLYFLYFFLFENPILSYLSKLYMLISRFSYHASLRFCQSLNSISAAMICFYSYVLLAGGNPPPKKAKAAA